MLPPYAQYLKDFLDAKGLIGRTIAEQEMLNELVDIDRALDDARNKDSDITKSIEKRASGLGVMGPAPGSCFACGRAL